MFKARLTTETTGTTENFENQNHEENQDQGGWWRAVDSRMPAPFLPGPGFTSVVTVVSVVVSREGQIHV